MTVWSDNDLVNGDAEAGDLTGWAATNVTVVDGGVGGGSYCFLLETTASMTQEQVFGVQPPQIKVSLAWLPEDPIDPLAVKVDAQLETVLEYADGSSDTAIVPLI